DDLGQSGWLTVDELERFAEWLDLDAETRLLDVGCGAGGPALRLAETIGLTVVGVDILAEGIDTARQLARERGLEGRASFLQVDRGGQLPFEDASFDAALSVDAMCHLPDRLGILQELHGVTSPGARVLLPDPPLIPWLVTGAVLADRRSLGVSVFLDASASVRLFGE